MTLAIDLGYIRTLLAYGAAVHGLPYSPEPVDLARIALRMYGLVGRGVERDRRPAEREIERLIEHFRGLNSSTIPVAPPIDPGLHRRLRTARWSLPLGPETGRVRSS